MARGSDRWLGSGEPGIWLTAGAISLCIILVAGLLLVIAVEGLGHFWPRDVAAFEYLHEDGSAEPVLGEIAESEIVPASRLPGTDPRVAGLDEVERLLVKVGNRDVYGMDFRWLVAAGIRGTRFPEDVVAVERREWGNLYGFLVAIRDGDRVSTPREGLWEAFQARLEESGKVFDEIRTIEKGRIGAVNYEMERLRLARRELELAGGNDPARTAELDAREKELQEEYGVLARELERLYKELNRYSFRFRVAGGQEVDVSAGTVVRAYRPNAMSVLQKAGFYLAKLWEFVSEEPREANTEGGIFPAIFGTVLMVFIMAVLVTPLGVIAAVYLREYAKQGPFTQLVRISVNNLAGVPSIVYGVFGLGFFVYFLGGNIDRLFFPEALPNPTFGTPGLLWASLTLALLTVPVVIVSTEEGLARVPRAIREGSLALGATKAETLWRTVLPMTASAMLTGLILAIARAAGEVAPLMLVGVVKLAPSLPLDGSFPFLHLERKFMHLGFHIYDVGFQSPNVEAARPLVYATSLLLVLIVIALNLTAIRIRNRLREKYRAAEQ
jgi:phosphate transport system permease protein